MTVSRTGQAGPFPPPPRAFRAVNAVLNPVKRQLFRLTSESVIGAARKRTTLTDFGDDCFREPLGVLIESLERDARLHAIGRMSARRQLVELLSTRLRVHDLLERRPEILETPVEQPIIILGLPRTGTTVLQRLLAQDRGLRSLPYWEAMFPLPAGDAAQRPDPSIPDPRIRKAEQSLKILHYAAPLMLSMHEMEAEAPDEEIWLLAVDFATMLFEASYRVPGWRDWYCAHDQTAGYRFLSTMLQVLQWFRPGERWLLKSPQHLEQIPVLLSVFPDATIVQTHRDPTNVTASLCSMETYGRRMNSRDIDAHDVGAYWSARIERMLRASIDDRPDDDARFTDVQFRALMADPIATVKRIYEVAARELTPEAEASMRAYLDANPRGKHGAHTYRLEDYGLDAAALRNQLRFYTERFDVPLEP
jgi:hypothetical protein